MFLRAGVLSVFGKPTLLPSVGVSPEEDPHSSPHLFVNFS